MENAILPYVLLAHVKINTLHLCFSTRFAAAVESASGDLEDIKGPLKPQRNPTGQCDILKSVELASPGNAYGLGTHRTMQK